MKPQPRRIAHPSLFVASLLSVTVGLAAREPAVDLHVFPGKDRVAWTIPPADTAYAQTSRRMQLEYTTDFVTWTPTGVEFTGAADGPGQSALDVTPPGPNRFYRLTINDTPNYLATGGAAVFGYQSALAERLAANIGVTASNFTTPYPVGSSLSGVSFDVSSAEFYTEWNTDPAVWNAGLPSDSPDRRLTDFRLDAPSLQKLQTNGFVVSEARGATSFTDLYYRIWTDDLPVYVSSDSILHAWHRTWITLLEEVEELALRPRVETLLAGLTKQLTSIPTPSLSSPLRQGKPDAATLVSTASDLMRYATPPSTVSYSLPFSQKAFTASGVPDETLFGGVRTVNWTQFAPRSHYTNSESLKSYFRAMMWMGNIDFRIDERADDLKFRQLMAAVVVTLSLRDAGLMDEWEEIDRMLTTLVGRSDNLTPPQLLEILQSESLTNLSDFTSWTVLENLLVHIQAGQAGVQDIAANPIAAPVAEQKRVLPRSFALFGQRFTPESWALGRTVFDNIWRANPDPSGPPMLRVHRRLPSALDLAFSVLGNNTPARLLAQRMNVADGVPYRDGYDFARELVSVREVIDSQPAASWEDTVYLRQLAALRSLSAPLPLTAPEAMRTEAWNWKTVQTQLAGWTELRHDNLLYAKQSYTPPVLCFYPAGYVEPRPAFYTAMKQLVDFASASLASLPLSGTFPGRPLPPDYSYAIPVDIAARQTAWVQHLAGMSASLQTLAEIAQTELNQTPFSSEQTTFIRGLVQAVGTVYVPNNRTYTGWYPSLYLKSVFAGNFDLHPSEKWDPLVTDVHTDGPDPIFTNDPGAVLYNATGNIALLLVAIDVNGQRCLHGGPAFTYYEFTQPYASPRLNDETWKTQVRAKTQPNHPEWTNSWLVPGPITVPAEVN